MTATRGYVSKISWADRVRENIPSTAITIPAIPPGDNLGFGMVPLVSPAAVGLGLSVLIEVGGF
jgi:hypothetical protein